MSTLVLEERLLRAVRSLLTSSLGPVIPDGLELVDGRLYMPVKGKCIDGFLMVSLGKVVVVYDKTGDLRHNFQAKDEQILAMLKLLGK